tara:strand:- start:5675 stop:5980 length:306 start_codon:yes stop_codon:yes gene_type:complete
MPSNKRFQRKAPHDPENRNVRVSDVPRRIKVSVDGDIQAKDPDGNSATLTVSRLASDGLLTSDQTSQDLMKQVLYELKHIRLHLEVLSGEDLRGDVDYADQ